MAQTIHYVKPGGAGPGSSWGNAFGNIQTAINAASPGDVIYIASGQYTPSATIDITKPIKLYGGFEGNENGPDERAVALLHTDNETEIIGNPARAAVYIHPATDTDEITIDGISISGAGRSAIFIGRGKHVITWCKFENNQSPSGGAIHMASGQADISNCIFNQNMASESAYYWTNYPTPGGWTLTNYSANEGGWINGTNFYSDKEKAMYFDASSRADTYLQLVYLYFVVAQSAHPNKEVPIKIYDGTSGTPGSLLGTSTLTMGQIMSDVNNHAYSLASFSPAVNLPASKKFFVSVDLTNLQWNATPKQQT